jgi:hypothetical protein
MARSKTNPGAAAAQPDLSPTSPAQAPMRNGRDIARRAYELYLARGCEPGHDVADWLQAERELHELVGSAAV